MRKKLSATFWGVIAIALAMGMGGYVLINQDSSTSSHEQASQTDNQANIQQGFALYQKNCASCHGVKLEGQANWRTANANGVYPAPPHDETGHTWHHNDSTLFEYTKLGGEGIAKKYGIENMKTAMPAYGDMLSDDEILAILNYIKSTWSAKIRQAQPKN